jgi:DNA invertase Pin-like site-specific DNA recombinase
MHNRAAIYVRVSTDRQTVENQLSELRQIAERRGWAVVEEYRDAGLAASRVAMAGPVWTRCSMTPDGANSM